MTERKKPKLTVVGGTQRKTKQRSPVQSNGLTAKQEAFAKLVWSGENYSNAYRQAYVTDNMTPAAIHHEAHMLAQNPKVTMRLNQLSAEAEDRRRVSALSRREKILQGLEDIASDREASDGARVRAYEVLGKELGLWSDRVEVDDKRERSADEIEGQLMERLKRLGIG